MCQSQTEILVFWGAENLRVHLREDKLRSEERGQISARGVCLLFQFS